MRDGEATRRATRELEVACHDMEPEFQSWPKIPRLNRPVIMTEKIDGTNACVIVAPDGQVFAQSRKRIIHPGKDNFGFAQFVADRSADLARLLGSGYHYGEWFGRGIQRGYGLDDRWFALFNADRWRALEHELLDHNVCTVPVIGDYPTLPHACEALPAALTELRMHGSFITNDGYGPPGPGPDSKQPAEGVVIYHKQGNLAFKVTLEKDEAPKSLS